MIKTIAGGPMFAMKFFPTRFLSIDVDGLLSFGETSVDDFDLDLLSFSLVVGFSTWF
jgi:hypothetical protein